MKKYRFKGSVFLFNLMIKQNWIGETLAKTEKKAMSNLLYNAKTQMGYLPSANLRLEGKLMEA